jgi:Histidine kinase-, DNA gyrase B-, and HSP90-like ATPase
VTTRDLGDTVEVQVRDNGTGITPEIRDKLLQPFVTTKPTGEGTGLGLSIAWAARSRSTACLANSANLRSACRGAERGGGARDVCSALRQFGEHTLGYGLELLGQIK